MESAQTTKKYRWKVLLLSTAIPILIWFTFSHVFADASARPITVTGTIAAKEIPVASKVGGRIEQVLVQEGDTVGKGQTLIKFDMAELDAKRQQLNANIARAEAVLLLQKNGPRMEEIEKADHLAEQAKARWKMLLAGNRPEDIERAHAQAHEAKAQLDMLERGYRIEEVEQARALMEQASSDFEWAEHDFKRFRDLATVGAVSSREAEQLKARVDGTRAGLEGARQNYEKAKAGPRKEEIRAAQQRYAAASQSEKVAVKGFRAEEVEMARQDYLQAAASLKLLRAGSRKEEIARAQAELQLSRGQLAEIDAQLREGKIDSPVDGEVSVMDLHPGEVFAPNRTLATLTRLDDVWTRVYLPERQLARVRMGQVVTVKVDPYPGQQFKGKIVQIPAVAEFTPRNVQTPEERAAQVFAIKVQIQNNEHKLRGGMNAEIVLPPSETPWEKLARLGK